MQDISSNYLIWFSCQLSLWIYQRIDSTAIDFVDNHKDIRDTHFSDHELEKRAAASINQRNRSALPLFTTHTQERDNPTI